MARSKGAGRGFTGHKIILDEAYALDDKHMAALFPTLTAVPDPQVCTRRRRRTPTTWC
jgi:hypothetical protein